MQALHTIGYEGTSISEVILTLQGVGVNLLIDVREVPISRKRGFSKTALRGALESSGIEYLHLKGLGDPKQGRIAAREGRYQDFQEIFAAHMESSAARLDLAHAVSAARSRSACLLCFEQDYLYCHRRIVADSISNIAGFRVVHLSANPILFCKQGGHAYVRAPEFIG